uniref:Intermediate filament protein n=1 Tax=Globodera rostochiensis TaxID=31243 RepID=A0A914HWT3_GLORO
MKQSEKQRQRLRHVRAEQLNSASDVSSEGSISPEVRRVQKVEETSTTQTVPSRKRVPPPPPPKPPHSIFGTGTAHQQTTVASEPHLRESSFSSVYSNFPQTYSTLHTYNTMDSPASSDYRSAISSRPYFPRPRPLSPARYSSDGGPRVLKMVSECSSISSRPMSPYPGSTAASAIRDAREREKKEMSELNDRLANYIEKVRFLEAQNRKLATDLDFLHKRWGKDASNVREMYETDLRQAKKLLEEAQRQKNELEKKAKAMGDEMETLMKKHADALSAHDEDKKLMEELLLNLSSLEAELGTLKRRLGILEDDLKALRRENQHLSGETHKARTDLDQETLNRIDYQNQVQTLLEEIDFLRRAHEAEIQDLQAMASRDTTGENREFFRNELASAIREIRSNYDALDTRNRSDIESWYKMKVQEIQTMSARQNLEQNYAKEEVKRLRTQLGDLRGKLADLEGRNSLLERQVEELAYQLEDDQRAYESALNDKDSQIRKLRDEAQALMLELQMLLDTKQTLDAEIAIYRKMLEGEEDRSGLYQLVEQVVKSQNIRRQDEAESQRVLRGEKSSRQSYQRSAKGNVSVLETSPEGKYVVLENTHRSKEEPIGGWKLRRRIDGKREIMYTFPQEFVLRPGKTVKVWARGQGLNAPPDQLVSDGEESFGTGSNVQTLLYNRDGEERASLIQRCSGR